jgi:hypothetical protein
MFLNMFINKQIYIKNKKEKIIFKYFNFNIYKMSGINKKDQILLNDKSKNFLQTSDFKYERKGDITDHSFSSKKMSADEIEKGRSTGLDINQSDQSLLKDKNKCFMSIDSGYSYGDNEEYEPIKLDGEYNYKQSSEDLMKERAKFD